MLWYVLGFLVSSVSFWREPRCLGCPWQDDLADESGQFFLLFFKSFGVAFLSALSVAATHLMYFVLSCSVTCLVNGKDGVGRLVELEGLGSSRLVTSALM